MNKEIVREVNSDSGPLSPREVLWSLTRGESSHQKGRSLAVDGIGNVSEFLERLEETEYHNIDFLELRACDESCAGGVLISGNRFLTVERLNRRALKSDPDSVGKRRVTGFKESDYGLKSIPSRPVMSMGADRKTALEKMQKVEELLKVLPGIDCAACGSPSCRALAEDIVQERAELACCVFLQELYIREGKISIEKADEINTTIWGKMRDRRSQSK